MRLCCLFSDCSQKQNTDLRISFRSCSPPLSYSFTLKIIFNDYNWLNFDHQTKVMLKQCKKRAAGIIWSSYTKREGVWTSWVILRLQNLRKSGIFKLANRFKSYFKHGRYTVCFCDPKILFIMLNCVY